MSIQAELESFIETISLSHSNEKKQANKKTAQLT